MTGSLIPLFPIPSLISPAGLDLSYLDTTSPLAVAGTKTTGLYATTPTVFNTAAGPKTTGLDDDSNGGLKTPSSNHAANPYTPNTSIYDPVATPVPASRPCPILIPHPSSTRLTSKESSTN